MKQIRNSEPNIELQLNSGYETSNGFRDAFTKIMGVAPTKTNKQFNILKAAWLDSPLGPMLAIGNDAELYLLEFVDRRDLEREIENLRIKTNSAIILGSCSSITSIKAELKAYFAGTLHEFKTPLFILATPFQKLAWQELMNIPYGQVRSYKEQAVAIERHTSFRAVANANGKNQLAIIIPCHRIINSSGKIGGYGGGIARKKWLLEHESKNSETV